jgi:glycosyltransferase involved in cell wall biosynthesis
MSLPLVTVAVPTVGRLDYLKEAVGSVLAQEYPRVEVLVGDDGGPAELRAWCEARAARDSRVRYQRNARRLGLAGNWNALADAARGEFITIIGDDDRLLPEFVGKLAGAARALPGRPAYEVAFANHYLIDGGGARLAAESVECTRRYGRDLLAAGEVADAARAVWRNSVPMSAALVRTAEVRRLRFKEDLNTPELELFARLAGEGARFVFVPEYLAEYRTHARSATAAGLLSERLAERLLEIEVAPHVEAYKREFMSGLLVNAVSRCLERGERARARRLMRSGYYPAADGGLRLRASVCVQGVCAALPAPLGRRAYRLARRLKTTLRIKN